MRLIDADRLKEVFHRNVVSADAFDCLIDSAPTIDAVEVVRCKDCKYYSVEGETTRFGWCGYWNKPTDKMRYCSDGERS